MTHGSLFSGIGGFDLAARWMGWDNLFHVEFNPWCRQVLKHHFPESVSYNDVKTFDGTIWRGRVDVLSGGFPCQPYSSAGKRLGKDDERHLWPEMRRIISEVAPGYVVGENVRGITNWNGGVVFEEVCADLEAEGYTVWTGILPACGVGAPHRRDRVWFVAHANDHGAVRTSGRNASASNSEGVPERDEVQLSDQPGDIWDVADTACAISECTRNARPGRDGFADNGGDGHAADPENIRCTTPTQTECDWRKHQQHHRDKVWSAFDAVSGGGHAADTDHKRPQRREKNGNLARGGAEREQFIAGCVLPSWDNFPTQPPVCGGDDGLPRELDGVTFSKWRNESIKAYGNAIVPQVAHAIFRSIFDTASRF